MKTDINPTCFLVSMLVGTALWVAIITIILGVFT